MKKKFALQNVGRPYGPCEAIPGSAWRTVSEHTSLTAAKRELGKHMADMREIGRGSIAAWNDHFRIISLRDILITVNWHCPGPEGDICPDNVSEEIVGLWAAGEPEPDIETPHYCEKCTVAQDIFEDERAWAHEREKEASWDAAQARAGERE